MSPLEIFATGSTVGCVLLAVKRSIWQFPVGMAATTAFFFVFLDARLYASAGLQVFFSIVQIYGWWFWLYGDAGGRPRITTWPLWLIGALLCGGLLAAAALSALLRVVSDAQTPFLDSAIFALSATAQFLLDRKKIETWYVWALVNVLSVAVYAQQGLWLTTALYGGLFLNCAWGYWEWRREFQTYDRPATPQPAG
jgi:nicotinamide mononucleotide transporter